VISFRGLIQRVTPGLLTSSLGRCSFPGCARALPKKWRGSVTLNDAWYCSAQCFEVGLREQSSFQPVERVSPHRHRIPLGLLLLSQEQITSSDLASAIQHQSGRSDKRLGSALQEIAGVSENVIAHAVAAQWGCPAFTSNQMPVCRSVHLPYDFLRAHEAVPLYWDARARTLLVGFLSRVDHVAVAAIERVLQCSVNPCITTESLFERFMLEMSAAHPQNLAIFRSHMDGAARARIVRNYVDEIGAQEVRAASSARYVWVRLNAPRTVDLLFARPSYAEAATEI